MAIGGTFGGYVTPTNPITAAAQVQLLAILDQLKVLIKDPSLPTSSVHPDFDLIHPNTARMLRAEIDQMKIIIDATAVA